MKTPLSLALALLAVGPTGCGSSGGTAPALAPDAAAPDAPGPPDAEDEVSLSCDKLPPVPWSFRLIAGPPRSEDFTFDNEGYFLGLSKNNLVRLANGGAPQLVAANVAITGTGVRVLPNGDIAVADEVRGAVVVVDAAGDRRVVGSGVRSPNGLQLGPGGRLFLSDLSGGNVYVIDPQSSATTLLSYVVDDADGLVFSNDYRTLFVGSYGRGELYRVSLNEDGTAQPPARIAEGFKGADGITIDECGNLYVASYDEGTLQRVSPDGKVELVAALATRSASAVNFGSGRQGWDARTLYVMNYQDGGVFAVRVGVRGVAPPPARAP